MVQQRGSNQKWFKPKPVAEAEYELVVQQADMMSDANKHANMITIDIPLANVQPSLIDELSEICQANPGNIPLHLRIFDEIKQNIITLIAPPIRMNQQFYHWMKQQEYEDIFTHKTT